MVEDDAIIVEDKLNEDDKAILNAAKQKPLWEGGDGRVQYDKSQLFSAFIKQDIINFDLFDNDYMSVYDVFNQTPQIPFGQEAELIKTINVKAF